MNKTTKGIEDNLQRHNNRVSLTIYRVTSEGREPIINVNSKITLYSKCYKPVIDKNEKHCLTWNHLINMTTPIILFFSPKPT